MAKVAIARPFAERHLDHEFGLDPHRFPHDLFRRARIEGALGDPMLLAPAPQLVDLGLRQAAPDGAAIHQPTLVVEPDGERPEGRLAGATALHEGTDDELLTMTVLDLPPRRRSFARDVHRVEPLRHDALGTLSLGCFGKAGSRAGAGVDLRKLPYIAGLHELLQQLPTLLERQSHRLDAVDGQHVEDHERGRMRPALQPFEVGDAIVVEAHDFPVEDGGLGIDVRAERTEMGPLARHVDAIRGLQRHLAVDDVRKRAVAVPLDLVSPAIIGGGKLARCCLHRFDPGPAVHRAEATARTVRSALAGTVEVMSDPSVSPPAYRDLPIVNGHRASWGVWPAPDYFGCLNLLTPERVVAAAGLVQTGQVFPMNWDMRKPDPPLFGRARFEHEVTGAPTATSHDDVLHGWNTQSSSQWDGFRHIRNEPSGHYGGVPDEEHGMHHWAERGIAGRCVLADVARWRISVGRPLVYDEPDPITTDDVAATLAAQGTTVETGDVLLLRTGWCGWYEAQDPEVRERMADPRALQTPGLRPDPSLGEFLWDLHIAAIGADNPAVEVWPPGALADSETRAAARADQSKLHEIFNHTVLLPMLGIPLGEMFQLDRLAAACADDGRYEAMFVSAPLNLPAGVASPPNALVLR